MGLFFRKAKKQNDASDIKKELIREDRELKKKLEQQKRQTDEIYAAEKKYEADGNIDALLDFWKKIWYVDGGVKFNGNHWLFRYPDLLIKNKRYDEAWAILNKMSIERPAHLSKIRNMQHQILKSEKKNYKEAIFLLMSSVLIDLGTAYDPMSAYRNIEKERFIKRVLPLVKKAKWDETDVDFLVNILEKHIRKKDFKENSLRKSFENFAKEKCKNNN